MWAAALVSIAGVTTDVGAAVEQSLGYVPAGSRLAEALGAVSDLHQMGYSWRQPLRRSGAASATTAGCIRSATPA